MRSYPIYFQSHLRFKMLLDVKVKDSVHVNVHVFRFCVYSQWDC